MNTPKIRFRGFKDAWEQRKSGQIAPLRGGYAFKSNEYCSDGIPIVRISNILSDGSVGADFAYYDEQDSDEIYTLYDGAVVLAMSGATTGKVSVLCDEKGQKYYQNQRVGYFIPTDICDYKFVKTIMRSRLFADQLSAVLVAGAQPNVSSKEIDGFKFLIPQSKNEQKKIGEYFSTLDNLITLHQRKCDEIKQLKKFMLQKMFPKNGEKNPEIRFEGFTDDWEQRKLDDWGTFYYGKSCPKWSVTQEATIPCIRYGELYTKFGAKIDRVYSYTNMPADNLRFSKGTEVLIPRVGEDPMDYNHCTWLSLPNIAIGEMISVFNTEQDPYFSAIMFNATLQKEFAMRVEGGSVTNLYFEKLKNIDVLYPSLDEQERIATYFGKLDHLITLHQRKCEKLKELKLFMLKNMFV